MPPPGNARSELDGLVRPARSGSGGVFSYLSLSGMASLGVGATLYLASLHIGRKGDALSGARHVVQLEDLYHLAGVLPALVAVRGRVGSHAPKKCELSSKLAVIHEVVEEEVWRKQRAEGRTVYEPFETRKVFEECEWYLEDGSRARVRVENALQADRLRTALEHQAEFVAEDLSSKTLGKMLMEKAWQMTKHGLRKTERYLPVGTVVTCVGELDVNRIQGVGGGADSRQAGAACSSANASPHPTPGLPDGWRLGQGVSELLRRVPGEAKGGPGSDSIPFVLRKPVSGPSYITPLTLDQLKAALSSAARNCRWLALAFGAVGLGLVVHKAVGRLLQAAHEQRVRQRVAAAEAARKVRQAEARKARQAAAAASGQALGGRPPSAPSSAAGLAAAALPDEDDAGGDDRATGTCVVCLEEAADMVFISCGHMCCCVGCGVGLKRCPICRVGGRAIKVFKP